MEAGHGLVDIAVIACTLYLVQPAESVVVVLNLVMIQMRSAAGLLLTPLAPAAVGFAVRVAEAEIVGLVVAALAGPVGAAAHELVAEKAALGMRNPL